MWVPHSCPVCLGTAAPAGRIRRPTRRAGRTPHEELPVEGSDDRAYRKRDHCVIRGVSACGLVESRLPRLAWPRSGGGVGTRHDRRLRPRPLRAGAGCVGHLRAGARRAAGRAQTRALDVVRAPPGRGAGPQPNRPEVCRVGPPRGPCLSRPPRARATSASSAPVPSTTSPRPTPEQVLGGIDAVKLRSSMTLFERAAGDDLETAELFGRVLDHYFDGRRDDATLGILGGGRPVGRQRRRPIVTPARSRPVHSTRRRRTPDGGVPSPSVSSQAS